MIITSALEETRREILHQMGRGITSFKTFGGYSGTDREVLFCVITRLENTKLEQIVLKYDPNAFMVILPVLEAKGGVLKRRHLPNIPPTSSNSASGSK